MSEWLTSIPVGAFIWVLLLAACVGGSILIERGLLTGRTARRLLFTGGAVGCLWLLLVAWRFVFRA